MDLLHASATGQVSSCFDAPVAQLSVKRLEVRGAHARVNEVRINPALRNFEQGFWSSDLASKALSFKA